MNYKSSWECRREGERKFERNPFGGEENPYPEHGSYDDLKHHRDWDDGFRGAQRREEEKREEEEHRERLEQRRINEREEQCRREEEEYWAQKESEREAEQQEELSEGMK